MILTGLRTDTHYAQQTKCYGSKGGDQRNGMALRFGPRKISAPQLQSVYGDGESDDDVAWEAETAVSQPRWF